MPAPSFSSQQDRVQFAQRVLDCIREAGEARPLAFDEEQFRIQPQHDPWPVLNLTNVFKEYCAAAEAARPAVVRNVVRNWFADRREIPEVYEDLHPDLLPSVRSRAYFEFTRLQMQLEGHAPLSWAQEILGEHLTLGLVYDLPEMMRLVGEDDLAQWNVTYREAIVDAAKNLAEMGDHPFLCVAPGLYASAAHDNYDAARIVLLELFRGMSLDGDPVVAVPNRDTLIVTGSENAAGLEMMADIMHEAAQHPRPITGIVFRLEGDAWRPWLPPPGHAVRRKLKLQHLKSLSQVYAEQKQLLDRWQQHTGGETFVANFAAGENPETGALGSYCVWTEGVDTLLPRADAVYLVRPAADGESGEVVASGNWQKVVECVGPLLEKTGDYPTRYRARGFPSEEQLHRIGRS